MKYTGVINVIDEEGNLVFEKELDPDEIIKILLDGYSDEEPEGEVEEEVPVAAPVKQRKQSTCGTCGQPGHNAKKCTRAEDKKAELADETAEWKIRKENKRIGVLSNRIKGMLDGGLDTEQIVEALPKEKVKEVEEIVDSFITGTIV